MDDRNILAEAFHYMNLVDSMGEKVAEDIVIAETGNFFREELDELKRKAEIYNTHTQKMSYLIGRYTANPSDSMKELLKVAIREAKELL